MTKANENKRLKRETAATYRWLPLIVEIGANTLRIRQKGRRLGYEIDYESVFSLGAKKEADRVRAERKAKRGKR